MDIPVRQGWRERRLLAEHSSREPTSWVYSRLAEEGG